MLFNDVLVQTSCAVRQSCKLPSSRVEEVRWVTYIPGSSDPEQRASQVGHRGWAERPRQPADEPYSSVQRGAKIGEA
jgi:hypothetical protein